MKNKEKRSLISQATFDAKKGINVPASAIIKSAGFQSNLKSMEKFFAHKRQVRAKAS